MLDNRKMFFKHSQKAICRFCKLSHRVYFKREVSFLDTILMLFITGLLTFAIWDGPDLRSMLLFMGMAFTAQMLLRMRYRESVKCPHCGFDPIAYKKDPSLAAKRVKEFLELRKDNPEFMLKPKPQIKPIYLGRDQMLALRRSESELLLSAEEKNKELATQPKPIERQLPQEF